MKKLTTIFILLSVILFTVSSCSVNKSTTTKSAPTPSIKSEVSPNKSEPVPGAEILIEQDNNKPQK